MQSRWLYPDHTVCYSIIDYMIVTLLPFFFIVGISHNSFIWLFCVGFDVSGLVLVCCRHRCHYFFLMCHRLCIFIFRSSVHPTLTVKIGINNDQPKANVWMNRSIKQQAFLPKKKDEELLEIYHVWSRRNWEIDQNSGTQRGGKYSLEANASLK